MPLVNDTIPNLINGISQQPAVIRNVSQCERQVNLYSSPVDGLITRPNLRYIAKIQNYPSLRGNLFAFDSGFSAGFFRDPHTGETFEHFPAFDAGFSNGLANRYFVTGTQIFRYGFSSGFSTGFNVYLPEIYPAFSSAFSSGFSTVINAQDAYVHFADRGDDVEYYNMIFTNKLVRVFSLDGTVKALYSNALDYLATPNPGTDLVVFTVADTTFVCNKRVIPQFKPVLSSSGDLHRAIIYIKGAQAGFTYELQVTANHRQVTYGHSNTVVESQDAIAIALVSALTNTSTGLAAQFGGTWTVQRSGDVIIITPPVGMDYSVSCNSTTLMKSITNTAQKMSDLPTNAIDGHLVKIIGETGATNASYWVQFKGDTGLSGLQSGSWQETLSDGITYILDETTMPHKLVREDDGTFTFEPIDWVNMSVGDKDTVPNPSFIGQAIKDMFFFKNRLGVLAGENSVMSRSGAFYDFFPETLTTVLDDGPIDTSSVHTKVSLLNHAIPFNEQLILFSNQTEFTLKGGDLLTSKTVSIVPSAEYECSASCRPISLADNVMFNSQAGDYTIFNEYYIDANVGTNRVAQINKHCPTFIPKGVYRMAGSSVENVMLALSKEHPSRIYVYKFLWNGSEKIQSSWSYFELPSGFRILNVGFIKSELYVLYQTLDGLYVGAMNFQADYVEPGMPFRVYLDARVKEDTTGVYSTYNSVTDQTTFVLPYSPPDDIVVVTRTGDPTPGREIPVVSVDSANNSLVVAGDHTDTPVYIGIPYEYTYVFSPFFVRVSDPVAGTKQGTPEGRLQLRTITIEYGPSGYFEVVVTPKYGTPSVYPMSGRIQGEPDYTDSDVVLSQGEFRVPVLAQNTEVEIALHGKSYKPAAFVKATWEGMYTPRSKSI